MPGGGMLKFRIDRRIICRLEVDEIKTYKGNKADLLTHEPSLLIHNQFPKLDQKEAV